MKKYNVIFLTFFLAVILLLTFLTVKFFLNQNNSGYSKINWEQPEEELKDNLILAPLESADLAIENPLKEPEKPVEKTAEKSSPASPNLGGTISSLKIENRLVSWGFTELSRRTIDTIVIHSSYDALTDNSYSLEGLIKEYQQYGVAPHYLIDRKGIIYRLVADKDVAYHAGESQVPDGRKNVNNFSLGIEMMNTKTDSFTEEQYAALEKLIDFLKRNYKIKYVLGHNQIAPGRKDDPWNFDWKKITK
ncbi:N-acetylmuramoyl-L-alanine amidase [Patescibacteria group bacterium]|nr:N-acetylmuramoyl-L-alanine amidase [Patescibacteria group bacterium]